MIPKQLYYGALKNKQIAYFMKKRIIPFFLLTLVINFLWSCNATDQPQNKLIAPEALKTAMATEPAEVATTWQKAENYYAQRNFAEAKKQYEAIIVQAKSNVFQQYANQQIAKCDSMLQTPTAAQQPLTQPSVSTSAKAKVSNDELKSAMASEPTQITELLKEAESYYIQRQYDEAKKGYQSVIKQTSSDIYQRYANQQITVCDSILAAQGAVVKPKVVEPLPPPTLAWWKNLDTTWQNIIRAQYFKGDATEADIKKMHENRAIINCSHRAIKSLDPIAPLSNLLSVDISDTKISSLAPLSHLPKISLLRCNNTAVSDLSPLAALQSIRELRCAFSPITDLSPLRSLKDLHYIDASGTKITSLAALSEASLLENASFSNVRLLRSLEGLSSSALKKLDVSATSISSLAPLKKCMALEVLNISGTKVSSLGALNEHQYLKKLYCRGTSIAEPEIKQFKQKHPACEIVR